MKLRSRITPRHTDKRLVNHFGHPYLFTKQANGQFECDVSHKEHATQLIATGDFSPADASLKRDPAPEQKPNPDENDAPVETDLSAFDDETVQAAQALVDSNAADIGANMGNVSSMDVIHCARALEQAEDGKNRKGVMKLFDDAIEHAKQAGVS